MEYLTPIEVNDTLWSRVFSVNYTAGCCGCHIATKLTYAAMVVMSRDRAAGLTQRLKSCSLEHTHSTCKLCQPCGKKLGFEW